MNLNLKFKAQEGDYDWLNLIFVLILFCAMFSFVSPCSVLHVQPPPLSDHLPY